MISGAPALTSRGLVESDFVDVMSFLDEAVTIALEAKQQTGTFNFLGMGICSWLTLLYLEMGICSFILCDLYMLTCFLLNELYII